MISFALALTMIGRRVFKSPTVSVDLFLFFSSVFVSSILKLVKVYPFLLLCLPDELTLLSL